MKFSLSHESKILFRSEITAIKTNHFQLFNKIVNQRKFRRKMSEYMGTTKCLTKDSFKPAGNQEKIRLYSNRFCPYAKRVKLVLAFYDIPHETVNIHLNDKPDWFAQA